MAVLALVMAALLGLLLGHRFQLRRQRASSNDLSRQYSALSQAYDELEALQQLSTGTDLPGTSVTIQGNPENE
ncbi:MAG: hypothetical protein ACI4MK_03110 [Aristaeellaceae bacterium]